MRDLLNIENLSAGYGQRAVLRDVSLCLKRGEVLGIIGPNGCGKSTLVKTIAGFLPKMGGRISICGDDVATLMRDEMARRLGVVPQQHGLLFSFTVRELVEMGRYPHRGSLSPMGEDDRRIIDNAIRDADMEALADREADHLSGGEIQRMFIARALAQQTEILLLDEPNTHLDLAHQEQVFSILKSFAKNREIGVMCVLHDMNLASEFCDRIILLSNSTIAAEGEPAEIITPEMIGRYYGVKVQVHPNPVSGKPMLISEHRWGEKS